MAAMHARSLRCVRLFATPWALQPTRLLYPWGSPGKNIGVGCHFLLPGDLLHPGIKPTSPVSPALAGGFFTSEPPGNCTAAIGN